MPLSDDVRKTICAWMDAEMHRQFEIDVADAGVKFSQFLPRDIVKTIYELAWNSALMKQRELELRVGDEVVR